MEWALRVIKIAFRASFSFFTCRVSIDTRTVWLESVQVGSQLP